MHRLTISSYNDGINCVVWHEVIPCATYTSPPIHPPRKKNPYIINPVILDKLLTVVKKRYDYEHVTFSAVSWSSELKIYFESEGQEYLIVPKETPLRRKQIYRQAAFMARYYFGKAAVPTVRSIAVGLSATWVKEYWGTCKEWKDGRRNRRKITVPRSTPK